MKVTYDQIEANIGDVDVDGSQVEVTWKCPVSGRVVCTSQATMDSVGGLDKEVSTAVKRTLLLQIMGVLNDTIAAMFGTRAGAVTRSATFAASTNLGQSLSKAKYSQATQNAAVVKAFVQVRDNFHWDEDREIYVAKPET